MNAKEAHKKLVKLIGPRFAYKTRKNALTGENRERAKRVLQDLNEQTELAKAELDARRQELLRDPEYVEIRERLQSLRVQTTRAAARAHTTPITVGRSDGMFFYVEASGDTWAEVVAKVEEKREG